MWSPLALIPRLFARVMVVGFTVEKSRLVPIKQTRPQRAKQLLFLITNMFTFNLYVICLRVYLSDEKPFQEDFLQFVRKGTTAFYIAFSLYSSGTTFVLHTNPSVIMNMVNWATDIQRRVWNNVHVGKKGDMVLFNF